MSSSLPHDERYREFLELIAAQLGAALGSGVEAAAAMGAARQMIRALAQTLDNPVDVLDAVDRAFRVEGDGTLITAIAGSLSADRRELAYASAGHPPALMRRADGSIEAPVRRRAAHRTADGTSATPATARLDAGSVVVLYTDGLTEATRDPIEGERRLVAALKAPEFAAQTRKALFLYERVLERRTHDDVALLVIELSAADPA